MGKKKLSLDFIRNGFVENKYILLATEYINCPQKLEYVCPNDHQHSISWDNWKQGHRCPYCAGQGKLTIGFIRKSFNDYGYKLLTSVYINSDQQLNYVCQCGHKHSMKWNNWRIGRRCPSCKYIRHSKKISGSGHYNWKGGVTQFNKELRNFIKHIGWSKQVLKRDNYTCTECKKRGGKLVAHHVITLCSIKERFSVNSIEDSKRCDIFYDINNGITLCEKCHKVFHKELKGDYRNVRKI